MFVNIILRLKSIPFLSDFLKLMLLFRNEYSLDWFTGYFLLLIQYKEAGEMMRSGRMTFNHNLQNPGCSINV